MKNRMPKRKTVGKVSRFLHPGGIKHNGMTDMRKFQRQPKGGSYPSSVKVGAGSVCARRSCNNKILHKRDHRSPAIIGADKVF